MNKVISFSLFGNNPKYTKGAIQNVLDAKRIYPGWTCYIYYSNDVGADTIDVLKTMSNCTLMECQRHSQYDGLFWRFLPLMDKSIDVWISRDCDSRLSHREKNAVDEWLASGKTAHVMRDSHNHCYEIMAGMFGINNRLYYGHGYPPLSVGAGSMKCSVRDADQQYLIKYLWPVIRNDHMSHDHWHHCKEFHNFDTDNKLYSKGIKHWIDNKSTIFPELFNNTGISRPFKDISPHVGLYVGQIINADNTICRSSDTEYEYLLRGVKY